MMRVIITKLMLPMIVQGATPAEVAELARLLGSAVHGSAVGLQGTIEPFNREPCKPAAKPLKAVCYAPAFGLTPEGVAAVRRRRTRQARGGGRVTVGRLAGQPDLPMDLPAAAAKSSIAPDSSRQLSTAIESPAAATKTTGHGGQASHPPAPESLVQLMRLLISRYKVEELAAKIPLDEAQVIRMYKGKRGTSPKTLRRLIELAKSAKLPLALCDETRLWADTTRRAHHLPKSWK